jgi:murein L,D-transpeptidase YafK
MTPPLTVQQTPQAPQQQAVQQQASAPTQTALAPPQQNVAVQPPQPIAPASAQRSERGIIQFVNDWARAWESRDLERYSRFYDAQTFPIGERSGLINKIFSARLTVFPLFLITLM